MAAAIAEIGHNSPPPLETWKLHIEDLMHEAEGFLDGAPILAQAEADSVGKLLGMLREARKGADEQRKIEKAPHDAAGKAVQAAWTPLLDRVGMAEDVAKRALAPFLAAQETKAREHAAEARRLADEASAAAREALRAAEATNLAGREDAERLVKAADRANREANRADKVKPMAAGTGRSVSLRSVWTATITDRRAALNHLIKEYTEDFAELVDRLAQIEAKRLKADFPGATVTEERIAQ